ncbi:MAG: glycosyltransferase family 4 protein [Crocinitomicaceae bacterium]|nr:glycosyltransferase family 4 protein [Crocinitomicaceae bacterium]
MKTILITAYSVNPYKGSEDGTGWNLAKQIAKENKIILITRKNNVPHLNKYFKSHDDPILSNIEYHGFDLPSTITFIKKKLGSRGYVAYYYLWQLCIIRYIKKKKFKFDIAHSLNFHSDSQPTFLWVFKKPTFWGPIGHHPKVPKEYLLKFYGWRKYFVDRLYYSVKWCFRNLDPLYRYSVKRVTKIFVINSSVESVIKANSGKIIPLSAVGSDPVLENIRIPKTGFNVLSVGRFHYMKGFDITIKAFAQFYHSLSEMEKEGVNLTLVGKGEERNSLLKLAEKEGVSKQIAWINWVNKSEMSEIYRTANAFLFPSHEGAGMVIPEALSYGLPILCFDNVGPGELAGDAGVKIKYSDYKKSISDFADNLVQIRSTPILQQKLRSDSLAEFKKRFIWDVKGDIIQNSYSI